MVLTTFIVVVMRYVFDAGFVWLQESIVWMHAFVFMVGAAYTLQQEEHVRVDVFYGGMSPKKRAWTNAIGVVILLLPLCAYIAFVAFDFVMMSWQLKEASRGSGGLPFPFVPLMKSLVLFMPLALALQGSALLTTSLRTLLGHESNRKAAQP